MSRFEQRGGIEIRDITKRYLSKTVFTGLHLNANPGELTVITGASGSGKTTLLNVMSGVDRPSSGEIFADGIDITKLSERELTEYRANTGQVFQRSGLISGLTAMENIDIVHELAGKKIDLPWTLHMLGALGVEHVANESVTHLSGGQAQRIAVVRALAHNPDILFADEPTASLDSDSKREVHEALRLVADNGIAVVMATHEDMSKDFADKVVEMKDGAIVDKSSPDIFGRGKAAV